MKRFFLYHFPALMYAVLVIGVSSLSRDKLPEISFILADKFFHFLEYAVFAVLIFRSFSDLYGHKNYGAVTFTSLGFLILFAVFDEYFQSKIPGRNPDVYDFILDFLGAFLMLLLLWARHRRQDASN